MSQQPDYNPFAAYEKVPAVSWANVPPGTTIVGRVLEPPREVQAHDFATGKPEVWEKTGNPKMNVVTRLDINGEKRDLWCIKPSALYQAIVDALQRSTGFLEVGGTLRVTYTGDRPPEKAGMNPAKQFAVDYAPPNAFAQPQQQQQQPSQQPPMQPPTWQQQPPQNAQQQMQPQYGSPTQPQDPPF